ncbi:hypothetical protein Hanom_Chr00s000647g01653381 [Helianthus anomalus]
MRGPPPPKRGGAANQSGTNIGDQNRWEFTEEREERERSGPMNFFFVNKKPSHLSGECRHQFRVLGEFKRGVDVAHEDWLCVREETHIELRSISICPSSHAQRTKIYLLLLCFFAAVWW